MRIDIYWMKQSRETHDHELPAWLTSNKTGKR